MKVFQTLVACSAVQPSFLSYPNVHPVHPVMCSRDKECPRGTTCYKIYGDTGFCVLTIPSNKTYDYDLTDEDKQSYYDFTGRRFDD